MDRSCLQQLRIIDLTTEWFLTLTNILATYFKFNLAKLMPHVWTSYEGLRKKVEQNLITKSFLVISLNIMFIFLMIFKMASCFTSKVTIRAKKWFFTGVNQNVSFHVAWLFRYFLTKWTSPLTWTKSDRSCL